MRGLIRSEPALEAAERVIVEAEQELRKAGDDPVKLKAEAQRLGITQAEIAAEATKTSARGSVGITTVSRTLSGTGKSRNVLEAVKRLIEQATLPVNVEEVAASRKAALTTSGHVYEDLARLADVSYPMVYKWMNGHRTSARLELAYETLTGVRPTVARKPPVAALPQRVGAGHPLLAVRLRELGIGHDAIAQAVGCSRPLVSHVLKGRAASARGMNTAVVQVAERLIAQATGGAVPPPSALSMREELQRERKELDELRRRARAERSQTDATRREVARTRRQLEIDRRALERDREVHRARLAAAGIGKRLAAAGISLTQVARAARCDLSHVSRTLSGQVRVSQSSPRPRGCWRR